MEAIAGFLAVAAHLLVLKSRAIVPREPPAHAEGDEAESEDELVARLRLYAAAQRAAGVLAARQASGEHAFSRGTPPALPLPASSAWTAGQTGATGPGLARRAGGPVRRPSHG